MHVKLEMSLIVWRRTIALTFSGRVKRGLKTIYKCSFYKALDRLKLTDGKNKLY